VIPRIGEATYMVVLALLAAIELVVVAFGIFIEALWHD